ncbi:STAS domain-containing protein [Streptomyces sp. DSM 40750]|uniref:STAS domain-containing protein n=1 Tax=Streptomyces sp. DSM 40750 TaxID=2801030 RepID=UPI00214C1881|nr:STAS domain-containing protein [Streptomyces sp. DSM 40750]UUU19440.1 STAS domain-containing protein [Streptomyces sp. DSM 40750]UUU27216.1 STAS domain-containing protein [Streptomyces sp. DSM 40750]
MSVAQNPLSIKVELPRDDAVLLTIEGELDIDTATELQHHLANQLRHGRRHFLLDVSAVPFMDSSGMNIILRTYQEVRRIPGGVYIIAPAPAVRRILDLTGVSITVATVDSVDEALTAVDSGHVAPLPDEPPAKE